ncbi:MAG: HD domain-containing phosphohydrolase [Candidatus Dormibacteria bacterium]
MARILVAEDDALTRRFIEETLDFAGHEVTSASDGAEAISAVDSPGCFDAVITDYAMPHANGVDLIAHAQRVDPMISCIVVTAFRDLDLAMQAMQAGAVAFIPKPFKSMHLLTVLDRALERRELADEALRLRFLAPMLERFTMVLANALESKDYETQEHSTRLVGMSDAIARHIGIGDGMRSIIRFGACLHDIGKVAVPEALLRKPEALTAEERKVMQTHPEVGAAILADIDTWEDVRLIVRHHHEHFDGAGYPDGLRGERIPLGARIVSVVDAFDVMRTGRPYQPARSYEWILDELRRESGRQFDPDMVAALIAVMPIEGTTIAVPPLDFQPERRVAVGRRQNDAAIAAWLQGDAALVRTPIRSI